MAPKKKDLIPDQIGYKYGLDKLRNSRRRRTQGRANLAAEYRREQIWRIIGDMVMIPKSKRPTTYFKDLDKLLKELETL